MEVDIIVNNVKEMLIDRGDNIDEFEEHEVDISRDEFYNDRNIIEFHTSNHTIIFALTKKLRRSVLDELKEFAKTDIMKYTEKYNDKKNIILIFNNDTVSAPILQQLSSYDKNLQKNGGHLQFFHIKNLLYNPSKHHLVPKHKKLNQNEITDLMEKYLIKGKVQMPFILQNYVIAKWMGLRQGDIVKIDRYNENSGISYYYRVCV